jgi:FAD binding domain-containing protein/berberine-like enzyme
MQTTSRLSRRALLSGSAASLAVPLLPPRARAQPAPTVPEAAWQELDRNITGGVQRPNDPRFVRLTRPENLRYFNPPANPGEPPDPDAPCGVVRPVSPEEVAYAITWARKHNLPMVPRSGGHSYAGCSTVPGLVINSSAMRRVTLLQTGAVEAEGGALFGDMLAALRNARAGVEFGRYTVTHGRCPGVGLSAYLMGGGHALDSPYAGMGCDRVAQVEMVLADGKIVTASANDALFWAVRGGGGGNLGFATKWFMWSILVGRVTAFYGTWRLNDNAQSVFRTLLRALDAAPDKMGAEMTVQTTPATIKSKWRYQVQLICQLHGPLEEFDEILGKAIADADRAEKQVCAYADCSANTLLELPYWDAQAFFAQQPVPNRYQETSLFAREIPDSVIDKLFQMWPTWPGTVSAARWGVYRTGGKVNKVPPDATAFVHRISRWMIATDIDWSGSDTPQAIAASLQWQRGVQNTLSAMLGNLGSYYNFPDPELENHPTAYWGSNLERLKRVKLQVDPDLVFTPPHNQWIVPRI